jgi:IclR family transcriptional regulator, positive regulator for flagellar biogenesis
MRGDGESRDRRPRTQTLERGLSILRAFQCEGRPLANSTIARRSGLPRPTVSRLTRTLVELGYLERVPNSGEYRLGNKVFDIGNAYLRSMKICSIARPYIHAFVKQHDISIGIAAQDDLEMIYILWVKEPKTLTLRLRVGTALPISRTAVGKAYLWALPLEERTRLIARLKAADQKNLSRTSKNIESAFCDLDKYGYCVSMSEFQKDAYGISVPLVLDGGRTILALGGGGARLSASESSLRRNVAPALLQVACQIQKAAAGLEHD